MSKVLKLSFTNSADKKTSLSLPYAKEGLDEGTVRSAMATICEAKVFAVDGVDQYQKPVSAKYVETTTTAIFDDSQSVETN